MATLTDVRAVIEILTEAGLSEDTDFDMDHDILFIPWHDETGHVAERLESVGCHWDMSAGSWARY